jgi:hypothetical protein
MNEEETKLVNATARHAGVVGKNAVIPRYIINHPWMKGYKILDFGAGPKAIHTLMLRENGYDVDAYDIGDNKTDLHIDEEGKEEAYGLVFASNVLNVQPTLQALHETLAKIAWFTNELAVMNCPPKPRKIRDLSKEDIINSMMFYFKSVTVEKYGTVRVFTCEKK